MPVVNAKQLKPEQKTGIVEDVERGFSDSIQPYPWQTCTCIGDWHYNRSTYLNHWYKPVKQVVLSLIDIVSKNGNLLLSIPMRGDGTIDDQEIEFLKGMESWMNINGEAIFYTRPWISFGEGPTHVSAGMFSEGNLSFKESDVRFTSKGDTLFAFTFAWPANGKLQIRSLASDARIKNQIKEIALLGSSEKINWTQDGSGLTLDLPSAKPCDHAYVFKIIPGKKPFTPNYHVEYILPEKDNSFLLPPSSSVIKGSSLQVESQGNLGYWLADKDYVLWNIDVKKAGKYKIVISYAALNNTAIMALQSQQSEKVIFPVIATGGWQTYKEIIPGTLNLAKGKQGLTIKSDNGMAPNVNVMSVKLLLAN